MNKRGEVTYKDQFTPWISHCNVTSMVAPMQQRTGGIAYFVNMEIKIIMEQSKNEQS